MNQACQREQELDCKMQSNSRWQHSRMIKASLVLLVLICVAILVSWSALPAWRQTIESLSPVFSLVASIGTLTVFLQFYQTYRQAVQDAAEKDRQIRARFVARMSALKSEVLANILTCNLFNGEKDACLAGTMVPGIRFHYDVAADMIRTGEITHHKLRAELMSLISQMESLNTVIEQNMQFMIAKSTVDPSRQEAVHGRIVSSMQHLLNKAGSVRSQLAATQPMLEEFWKNPQKYSDESYLCDRLISDAVIR